MPESSKSALVVLIPEVELLVGDFRRQYDVSASDGLGAHITILFPFRPPDSLSAHDIDTLRALFAMQRRFTFSLARVDEFPSAIYLAPEPRAPFDALTRAAVTAFPDCPPYAGAFPDPLPHLTVAQEPPAENLAGVAGRVRSRVEPALPLGCSAEDVCLVVKRGGRWAAEERFALA